MSLHKEARRILHDYSIMPKKRFGQNFLVDDEILDRMISYSSPDKDDIILEVGAGFGFLTERLTKTAQHVVAVEIDLSLVRALRDRLSNCSNLTILKGDIMKLTVPSFTKVVSTPPYSISSPLLFWLLKKPFELAVLVFQEDFARRLTAPIGSDDYTRLTVTTYYQAEIELFDRVPRELFEPSPNVDSMIVRVKPRKPPFLVEDESLFFDVTRVIFTQKNKKLRNALIPFFKNLRIPKQEVIRLVDSLPFNYRRPRELAPEEIGLIVNELVKALRSRTFSKSVD